MANGGPVEDQVKASGEVAHGDARPSGAPRGRGIKIVREVSLALAVYGMAGWIYVSICALVAPDTLALPLTHLVPSLREDTSGVLSFIVSFLGFITFRIASRD